VSVIKDSHGCDLHGWLVLLVAVLALSFTSVSIIVVVVIAIVDGVVDFDYARGVDHFRLCCWLWLAFSVD